METLETNPVEGEQNLGTKPGFNYSEWGRKGGIRSGEVRRRKARGVHFLERASTLEAHRELKISPAEFDEVAAELARTLDAFQVPEHEKGEVLGAFAAHKGVVTEGYSQ